MLRKCIIVLATGLLLAAPASARLYKGDDTMLVSPYMIYTEYLGTGLTIHTEIPAGSVVSDTVVLVGKGGETIEPVYLKSDSRGNLVAKFAAEDVLTIVEAPRTMLALEGYYENGDSFTLTALITVR